MNIYLISANSHRLITEEINKIVKDEEKFVYNLNKSSLAEVLEDASYSFNIKNQKIIIASNADFFADVKLSDDETNNLLNYLEKPNPKTIIIFTTLKNPDSKKKIVKVIKEKYCLINKPSMDKKTLREEITRYLNNYGYQINYDEITYTLDNVLKDGNKYSYDVICNELDKIMLYYETPCTINFKDLKNILSSNISSDNFAFVNYVINKKYKEASKTLKDLKVHKVEPLTLIILLAREYRLMYYIKKYSNKNYKMFEIANKMGMQEWQVNNLYNNSINYTEKELLGFIRKLANLDLDIKKGLIDKDSALKLFIFEACS